MRKVTPTANEVDTIAMLFQCSKKPKWAKRMSNVVTDANIEHHVLEIADHIGNANMDVIIEAYYNVSHIDMGLANLDSKAYHANFHFKALIEKA